MMSSCPWKTTLEHSVMLLPPHALRTSAIQGVPPAPPNERSKATFLLQQRARAHTSAAAACEGLPPPGHLFQSDCQRAWTADTRMDLPTNVPRR